MNQNRNKEDLIIWTFDFALSTFYEIDTDIIQPMLPKNISTMEVFSGVSLINVTAFNFPAGALANLPEFQELIFSAIVAPDLSRGVPKFAMFVLSLGSSLQEHLNHSADYYKLPSYPKLIQGKIDKEKQAVEYSDSVGTILTMKNCTSKTDYKEEERYFQVITSMANELYVTDIYIKAPLFEHQESGDVGRLHTHPFFYDIDMEDAEPSGYVQMICQPGKQGQQFYYRPKKLT